MLQYLSAWPRSISCPCDISTSSSINQCCNCNEVINAMLNLGHFERYLCYLYYVLGPVVVARRIRRDIVPDLEMNIPVQVSA